jgi:septum site-determining protein MinD
MTRFIALVSGKGGVGKTTTALNIGVALNKTGKKTLLLDANLVTPNLAIHLGMTNPKGTVNQLLRKEKGLHEVTYLHESGVSIIPASPSYSEYQKTNPQKLSEAFEHLDRQADFVLVDSPSGLGYEVGQVLKNTDEAIIVTNPNLSSVMDALKTIKLAMSHQNTIGGIILNMSNRGWNELTAQEVEQILGYPIIGNIRHHRKFRKALHKQSPLTYLFPHSGLSKEYDKIAQHISMELK